MTDYFAIAVDNTDIHGKAKVFVDLCRRTGCIKTKRGWGEDPSTYILYKSQDKRDGATADFRESFDTARAVYSPVRLYE